MRNGYGNSRRKETEKFVYGEEKELNSSIKSPQNCVVANVECGP